MIIKTATLYIPYYGLFKDLWHFDAQPCELDFYMGRFSRWNQCSVYFMLIIYICGIFALPNGLNEDDSSSSKDFEKHN